MKSGSASTVVVIGQGPYPERGVGWEAGIYAAYFADAHVIGNLLELPALNVDAVATDVAKLSPDAVTVWGTTSDPNYAPIVDAIQNANSGMITSIIRDQKKGEVGTVFVRNR
jgi:hypothetical protein